MQAETMAGRLGVALAQALEREDVLRSDRGSLVLGDAAPARLAELGVDLTRLERQRRPVVRGCLDWSEREPHVASGLGAALASRFLELGWIARRDGTRAVLVTDAGRVALERELGLAA